MRYDEPRRVWTSVVMSGHQAGNGLLTHTLGLFWHILEKLMALLSLFRVPHAPREGALSYEETASSTASLTAADCARMDNFISTVLLDLPFSRHQITPSGHVITRTERERERERERESLRSPLTTVLPALSFAVWSLEHTSDMPMPSRSLLAMY